MRKNCVKIEILNFSRNILVRNHANFRATHRRWPSLKAPKAPSGEFLEKIAFEEQDANWTGN